MAASGLLLQTKFLQNRVVAALVVLLKVSKVRATVSNHLEKTTTGMEILLVLFEVRGQILNLTGEDSNLDVGRAAVRLVPGYRLDDGGLYAFR